MTDHSPVPENFVPCGLLLRTAGPCEIEPEHLLQVFGEQRERFVAVLRGFGADDWAAPTRCADWSAHDVVRHLCDVSTLLAATSPGDRRLDITAGFDPRVSPRRWAVVPADESRDATFRRFTTTTEQMLGQLRAWLAQDRRFDVHLPYGLMDWTVLALHAFWDSWLHERDVLLAQGREHPTDDDATFYATAYGLFTGRRQRPGAVVGVPRLITGSSADAVHRTARKYSNIPVQPPASQEPRSGHVGQPGDSVTEEHGGEQHHDRRRDQPRVADQPVPDVPQKPRRQVR